MSNSKTVDIIGITYNLKRKDSFGDESEEYDEVGTIHSLKREIEKYDFKVVLLEQDRDFTKRIIENKPDFVFNIAEGLGNTRSRESQVPCILESLGIPYSGSDPLTLGITLDKYLTNRILQLENIPVPLMYMIEREKDIQILRDIFKIKKSYIVKPRWEGSSKGIFLNSKVTNFKDLKARAINILYKYKQPVLIEEFLQNDEITVGVYGNKTIKIIGMMRIIPLDIAKENFLYCIENKREWRTKVKYEPEERITLKLRNLIKEYAIKAYKMLEIRDIARIDFRLDSKNTPKIIDINPLPGLSPIYSDLPILYRLKGETYSKLIKIILKESLRRYGFEWRK